LREQIAKKKLSYAALQLRCAQKVDQFGGSLTDFVNLADFFP
jgi:hypothetical protein